MSDQPQGAALTAAHTETDKEDFAIWLAAACQDCRSWNRVEFSIVFNRRLCQSCYDKWTDQYAEMCRKGLVS